MVLTRNVKLKTISENICSYFLFLISFISADGEHKMRRQQWIRRHSVRTVTSGWLTDVIQTGLLEK